MNKRKSGVKVKQIEFQGDLDTAFWDETSTIICLESGAGTGKSFMAASKAFRLCEENPGIRVAFIRHERVNLSESLMRTFEDLVLPKGHPTKPGWKDAKRANRGAYHFQNGSVILCLGLTERGSMFDDDDEGGRMKSFELDFVIIEEASECSFEEISIVYSRLRANGMHFHQMVLLWNPPSDPTHHVYRFTGKPGVAFHNITYHCNPAYFELCEDGDEVTPWGERGKKTLKGKNYIEGILGNLEGQMSDRFSAGRNSFNAALVHPDFQMQLHTANEANSFVRFVQGLEMTPEQKTKYIRDNYHIWLSLDWGYGHIGTVQCFIEPIDSQALNFDSKLWKYRRVFEFYRTGVVTDEMAQIFLEFCGYIWDEESESLSYANLDDSELGFVFPIFDKEMNLACRVIGDHATESRQLFLRGSGILPELANKTVDQGLKLVNTILRDNKLIIDLYPPIGGVDWYNNRSGKPTGLHMEFAKYRLVKLHGSFSSNPVKLNDDGCTALRYFLMAAEGIQDKEETYTSARKMKFDDAPTYIFANENERQQQTIFGFVRDSNNMVRF